MAQRRKFSAESTREAVAMLKAPGVRSVQSRGTGNRGDGLGARATSLAAGANPGVCG